MKKLTLELVENEIAEIDSIKSDDENAHSKEDELRDWFIKCCAKGLYTESEVKSIGKKVLSTNKINFARWCA